MRSLSMVSVVLVILFCFSGNGLAASIGFGDVESFVNGETLSLTIINTSDDDATLNAFQLFVDGTEVVEINDSRWIYVEGDDRFYPGSGPGLVAEDFFSIDFNALPDDQVHIHAWFSAAGGDSTSSQLDYYIDLQPSGDDGAGGGEPVPEPATFLLLSAGLFGLGGSAHKWRRK